MKPPRFLRTFSKPESREIAAMCLGAGLLILAAIVLSAPVEPSYRATPLGVTQGVPEYSGGYPSPLSCAEDSELCYPNTRVATISVHPSGVMTGQTVNLDRNGIVSTVGSPLVLTTEEQAMVVEWSCQSQQTSSKTCGGQLTCDNCCNCSWWGGCRPCYAPTEECGAGTTKYSDYSLGTGFQTSGAVIGSQTISFPTGASSYTYCLQWVRGGGAVYTVSAPVTNPAGTTHSASISANPSTIDYGSASSLDWITTEPAAQCSITP